MATQPATEHPEDTQLIARPIGQVATIESGRIVVRTDEGPDILVVFDEGTSFLRLPAGTMNLKDSTKIGPGDVAVGDRILVRGPAGADQRTIAARSVFVKSGRA